MLATHSDWHPDNVPAATDLPPSTFVLAIATKHFVEPAANIRVIKVSVNAHTQNHNYNILQAHSSSSQEMWSSGFLYFTKNYQ